METETLGARERGISAVGGRGRHLVPERVSQGRGGRLPEGAPRIVRAMIPGAGGQYLPLGETGYAYTPMQHPMTVGLQHGYTTGAQQETAASTESRWKTIEGMPELNSLFDRAEREGRVVQVGYVWTPLDRGGGVPSSLSVKFPTSTRWGQLKEEHQGKCCVCARGDKYVANGKEEESMECFDAGAYHMSVVFCLGDPPRAGLPPPLPREGTFWLHQEGRAGRAVGVSFGADNKSEYCKCLKGCLECLDCGGCLCVGTGARVHPGGPAEYDNTRAESFVLVGNVLPWHLPEAKDRLEPVLRNHAPGGQRWLLLALLLVSPLDRRCSPLNTYKDKGVNKSFELDLPFQTRKNCWRCFPWCPGFHFCCVGGRVTTCCKVFCPSQIRLP
uniref:Uncharacterized protein n=1 Tax=Chromera velia CCMP2878 TaxID=1169474 RepID=A0A0G4HYU0_9ALVE|eukprot:Cvel_33714.t1-p1 / transcript=Cvel_33714.t1 / gene=Cvel_33714 / organism=Chromera_velia_CCMP2878 / gene_product=hypothetical protein / transcript_product=hypothetical protein / location=Cvel_scaffold5560:525-4904(-) / protein_length=385 / sequence_SO=supercontig / SO=protein_coding / is_pseudo=false